MQSIITWIAYGLGTLFFTACVVAWWEHLGRDGQPSEEPDWDAPPRPLACVDVDLDDAPAQAPSGDIGERRQALGGAMTRMSGPDRRQGQGRGQGDTVPMILAGAHGDAAPAERRQRTRVSAGE